MRLLAVSLCLLLSGCRDLIGLEDHSGADADASVEPLPDAGVAAGADAGGPVVGIVPPIGRPGTVDVICWNVRQFPSTTTTVQDLADLLVSLDVDVAALMEIKDDAAFARLLTLLPGWQGYLGKGDGYIKLALVWRPGQVTVTGTTTIYDGDYDFPRPPLVATLQKGGASMTLVSVHLKAGRTQQDATRRQNANTKLVGWLGARGNGATLLCGDFNEDQDNAYASSVYGAYFAAPQTYRMLTAGLDHGGAATYLPGRIMFDQMISTQSLDAALAAEKPFIPALDRQFDEYEDVISDHLPVAVRIDLH